MINEPTYEEQFGPLSRRVRRLTRAIRWITKSVLSLQRNIVVEVSWRLGDEIMAVPIYESIRKHYPNSHITVLCNYPDVLIDNPFVDSINELEHDPDKYILLRSGPKNIYRLDHYAKCAGIPLPNEPPRLYFENWEADVLDELPSGKTLIAVSSGASWKHKRWDVNKWRTLCNKLENMGYSIVELGKDDESIDVGLCLLNRTSAYEAACVLHRVSLLVCCDSGLMHLCRAAGTPTLALFGPTKPTILIQDDPDLHVIDCGRECKGCWNDRHEMVQMGECPEEVSLCLDTIEVEEVITRIRELVPIQEST